MLLSLLETKRWPCACSQTTSCFVLHKSQKFGLGSLKGTVQYESGSSLLTTSECRMLTQYVCRTPDDGVRLIGASVCVSIIQMHCKRHLHFDQTSQQKRVISYRLIKSKEKEHNGNNKNSNILHLKYAVYSTAKFFQFLI